MCSARTGANWSALQACATRFCAMECGMNPLLPPPAR
jgi:hypothetical protein